MDNIRVLQIGPDNWKNRYTLSPETEFTYLEKVAEELEDSYELILVDKELSPKECDYLYHKTSAYCLYFTDRIQINEVMRALGDKMEAQILPQGDIGRFLLEEVKYFFPKPYGEKFEHKNVILSSQFEGEITWNGNYSVDLTGDFGERFTQILYWKNNIPIFARQVIDFWLEYEKTGEVEIRLVITRFATGSVSNIINRWEISEQELQDIVPIDGKDQDGFIFVSLEAKGSGTLRMIALHDRYSRGSHGYFLPGGERFVTSKKEEIFAYFDPGDLKPPLNVYFSGWKTREGFEGYNLMRRFGAPFLLIAEPRLEGGDFYIGSEEYEKLLTDVIKSYVKKLKFWDNEVIMAGLSMGTTGAMYYGCDIKPYAIVLGKPLMSIGTVAANEKWLRPGGFPTSLDVIMYQQKSMGEVAIDHLNKKIWDKFDATKWGKTKFVIAYMIEDDYDDSAYATLISHLQAGNVELYGKGLHGRHNDNTSGIVSWFVSQYKELLRKDFGRELK